MGLFLKIIVQALFMTIGGSAFAESLSFEQVQLLNNDKEVSISVFSSKEKKKILSRYDDPAVVSKMTLVFFTTVQELLNSEPRRCEFNLLNLFKTKLAQNNLSHDDRSLEDYLKLLRVSNSIDDILYKILSDSLVDMRKMSELNLTKRAGRSRANATLLATHDLNDLFSAFTIYPNEKNICSYQAFGYLHGKTKDVKKLISEAYHQEIISLESYHKLNYLNQAKLLNRDIWLNDYFKIIFQAKNKLMPEQQRYIVKKIEEEDNFSTEKIKRFSKITRRRLLYRKYDETQIILLAQVLQKASRRMGVDPDTTATSPVIMQEFVTIRDGVRETYVEKIELDVQSQYNLARRRMRKDIVDLQMMDIFLKQNITHEDVVMAALETGYISLEDIEYVVKYDDLWNPHLSQAQKMTGFIFNVAGYTTFFLPSPWNITASIAMGVIEGLIEDRLSNGADNDNPSSIID